MTAKKFHNFSNEDFTWKYDGIPYTFPAGQDTYLEDAKADHFAKHLVDREMNRPEVYEGFPKGIPTNNLKERAKFEAKCFPSGDEVSSAEALNLNEVAKEKKGRTKKVEEFADLKDKEPIQ